MIIDESNKIRVVLLKAAQYLPFLLCCLDPRRAGGLDSTGDVEYGLTESGDAAAERALDDRGEVWDTR